MAPEEGQMPNHEAFDEHFEEMCYPQMFGGFLRVPEFSYLKGCQHQLSKRERPEKFPASSLSCESTS